MRFSQETGLPGVLSKQNRLAGEGKGEVEGGRVGVRNYLKISPLNCLRNSIRQKLKLASNCFFR